MNLAFPKTIFSEIPLKFLLCNIAKVMCNIVNDNALTFLNVIDNDNALTNFSINGNDIALIFFVND